MSFESYEGLLREMQTLEKDYLVVEKNRMTLRSLMYIEKSGLNMDDYEISTEDHKTGYEVRDKKINLKTIEKRQIDYKENKTDSWHFETVEEFDNFSFNPIKKEVQFDFTAGGHK